jgi:hypothetical protein
MTIGVSRKSPVNRASLPPMSRKAIFFEKDWPHSYWSGYARSNDSTIPRAYSLSITVSTARTGAKTVLKGLPRISRQRPWPFGPDRREFKSAIREFSALIRELRATGGSGDAGLGLLDQAKPLDRVPA